MTRKHNRFSENNIFMYGYFRLFRSNASSAILPSSCADVFFSIWKSRFPACCFFCCTGGILFAGSDAGSVAVPRVDDWVWDGGITGCSNEIVFFFLNAGGRFRFEARCSWTLMKRMTVVLATSKPSALSRRWISAAVKRSSYHQSRIWSVNGIRQLLNAPGCILATFVWFIMSPSLFILNSCVIYALFTPMSSA